MWTWIPAFAARGAVRSPIVRAGFAVALAALVSGCSPGDASRPAAAAPSATPSGAASTAEHVCPMHPEVRSTEPGRCPKCGMPLEATAPREIADAAEARPDRADVQVDPRRVQRIGVRTARVERRPLKIGVSATGRVTWDESRLSDVSLRYPAWVKTLYVNRVGQLVRKGDPLFTVYSYELYMAQRELQNAVELDVRPSGISQVDEAKSRLRRLGVSEAEIAAIAKSKVEADYLPIHAEVSGYVVEKNVVEGTGIAAGQPVFRIARLDRVWVEADVELADLPLVASGAEPLVKAASVEVAGLPGRSFEGAVTYVYPFVANDSPTVRVRVELDNPQLDLRPGMHARVRFDVDRGQRLAVPDSAVIYAGRERLVFVDLGGGFFRPRPVEVGARSGDVFEVVSGLEEGESVVVSGNYLIAAESRLKSAVGAW